MGVCNLSHTQKCIPLLPTPRVYGPDASIKAKAMQCHITITVSALWFPGETDVQSHIQMTQTFA